METTEKETELELKNGKFFILENRSDEKNIKRYIYGGTKAAIDRIKELIKTVNADKIILSTVDISGKSWNITGVPWSVIAMGLIRGNVSIEMLEGVIENIEKTQDKTQDKVQESGGGQKRK